MPSPHLIPIPSHSCVPLYLSVHTQSLHIALGFCTVCWKHSLQLPCRRSCMVPHRTERAGSSRHVCTIAERSKVRQSRSLGDMGSGGYTWGSILPLAVCLFQIAWELSEGRDLIFNLCTTVIDTALLNVGKAWTFESKAVSELMEPVQSFSLINPMGWFKYSHLLSSLKCRSIHFGATDSVTF